MVVAERGHAAPAHRAIYAIQGSDAAPCHRHLRLLARAIVAAKFAVPTVAAAVAGHVLIRRNALFMVHALVVARLLVVERAVCLMVAAEPVAAVFPRLVFAGVASNII